MQPKLSLLNDELIGRIIEEAYQLMLKPGIKVQNAEARQLLGGCRRRARRRDDDRQNPCADHHESFGNGSPAVPSL